jgi:hypothetical protein
MGNCQTRIARDIAAAMPQMVFVLHSSKEKLKLKPHKMLQRQCRNCIQDALVK